MREFIVSTGGQTVVATTTLIALSATTAPNINVEFLRAWVGQSANATSAQQRIQIVTQAGSLPTVTGATPGKLKHADPNASIIVSGTLGTTWGAGGASSSVGITASSDNGGTKTVSHEDAFNVLNGWLHVPTPAETRVLPASFTASFGLYFPVAPSTLTNWAYGIIYREV